MAVVLLVLVLRRPLIKALSYKPIRRFEAGPGGVRIEYFDEKLEEARSELVETSPPPPSLPSGTTSTQPAKSSPYDDFMYEMKQLAEVAPSAAILESFARLEKSLRERLADLSAEQKVPKRFSTLRQLVRLASEYELITPSEVAAFDDVAVLRNLVAHGQSTDIDPERALEYASLVGRLIVSVSLTR